MAETQQNNSQNQNEIFKKSLTQILQDSKIDFKEAKDLLKKFDLEKQEIISVSKEQLDDLKNQFWEDFEIQNFKNYLEELLNYHLDTKKPDSELLYKWLTDFVDYKDWKNNSIEELDTSWSNLYIKHEWENVIITWQNSGVLFVEKVSKEDYEKFVKNYDSKESARVLEQIWFTGWLTLAWVLAFSIRAWIWLLLWTLWTWLWVYRGYQIFKGYNLSSNEALEVLRDLNKNPEIVKSYLFLSQIWYVTWYKNWIFETIDSEKFTGEELKNKEWNIKPEKYQLLRWLKEKWFNPKFLTEGKYELDMHWLWDNSPLSFDWDKIKFSTNYFEDWKELEWSDVKTAFEKIQLINDYLATQSQIKNNQNSETYNFSNNQEKLEKKLDNLKQRI